MPCWSMCLTATLPEDPRLPASLEVSGLIRRAEALGGSAMVLRKGEPEAGTILVIMLDRQGLGTAFERMPGAHGRRWQATRAQAADDREAFESWLDRRRKQDPDLWMIELIVADGERSILNTG